MELTRLPVRTSVFDISPRAQKDCGQVVQIRRNFIVLRPKSLLKGRRSPAINGLAFVISLQAIENRRVGDGV
jgi:hypothetical protein